MGYAIKNNNMWYGLYQTYEDAVYINKRINGEILYYNGKEYSPVTLVEV